MTSSSNFSNFSEFLLSTAGLGAFTGGDTWAVVGSVALATNAGVGSKLAVGTNWWVDAAGVADDCVGVAILLTLMKMLPWCVGKAALSSVISNHTM